MGRGGRVGPFLQGRLSLDELKGFEVAAGKTS